MTTREEALAFGLSYPDTCQDAPFHDPNWQLVRIKSSKKVFLWTYEKDGYINLNVKADPEWRDYWRSAFASVTAGYHLNKEHWSTIILDGTVPDDAIKNMIDESYRMVTDSPTKRIYEAVKKIPKGKVATYGQVAQMAGNPRMARAVGNALHKIQSFLPECMSSALPSQARIHPHLKVCCKNHPCPDAKKASNESPSSHLAQIHQVLDKRENHRDLRF